MSCTITIQVGDQEITLDPGADISANSVTPLASTISPDNLRALYGQLKDNLTLGSVLTQNQQEFIDAGKQIFTELLNDRTDDSFPTLLSAIKKEQNPDRLKALVAFAASLNGKEVIEGDNFFINPESTYKASSYSPIQIRDMVFKKDGAKVNLFNKFLELPGMNTLKMSIAYARTWKGQDLDKVKGAYISPDNIIQIVVPAKKAGYHIIDDDNNVTDKNLGSIGKSQIQDRLLHEMLHAVYTEAYYSDPQFRQGLDLIHGAFLTSISSNPKLLEAYTDPQEFIASVFEDKSIQKSLSKIKVPGEADLDTFTLFTNLIPDDNLKGNNLLASLIQLTGNKLGMIGKENFFDAPIMSTMVLDMDNIFYSDGISAQEEEEEMAPRGQFDSYYGNNRKAFYTNKRFQDKWNRQLVDEKGQNRGVDTFARDSFFKATVEKPSASEIDRLRPDDVVLLPWLNYQPAVRDAKGKVTKAGQWIEVGAVVDKDGKPIFKNGRIQIANIVRDEAGNVKKTAKGQIIKEMTQAFPIVYTNMDKQQVVVAKTTLKATDEFNKPENKKYNTTTFPYSLIKGIRSLDRAYFDHNQDYEKQLADAQLELDRRNAMKGEGADISDKKFDERNFYEERVEQLKKSRDLADQIKADIIAEHKKYGFSHKEGDKIFMNVTKEAYERSGYKNDDMDKRIFPSQDDAVFILDKSRYKTKDGKDQSFTYPNPKMFDLFWGDKAVAKDFIKSAQYAESISKGDLVRASKVNTFPVPGSKGEEVKVRMNEWLTVYKKVANGLMVTTSNGKGFIIPFNNISGYAKNKTTDDYALMLAGYMLQNNQFNNDAFTTKLDGKRGFNQEYIKFQAMQYNKKYNFDPQKDNTEEDAVKRFEGNLDYIKNIIKPNESYVRIHKKYTNENGKVVPYQVNGLVLAKGDDGLLVFTETKGSVGIEYIKYTDNLNNKQPYGSELAFYMENSAKVKQAWNEFEADKAMFNKNKQTANFVNNDNGSKTRVNDPRINPHGMSDVYDFYDTINGITLDRLSKSEGSVVSIIMNKDNMSPAEAAKSRDTFERKVVRVLPDGTVVVAEQNKVDKTLESGYKVKAGQIYARYVPREKIARIGFKLGTVNNLNAKGEDPNIISEFNQDLINRRKYLYERSKVDRDYNKFIFASSQAAIDKTNNKPISKEKDYWRFIPLTNLILEPQSKEDRAKGIVDDRAEKFLNKDFKEVPREQAAHVIATFTAGTTNLKYVNRGIMVGTSMIYKGTATFQSDAGKTQWRPELLDALYAGDWITTVGKDGTFWDAPIERIESGKVYTLNTDLTTDWVNPDRIYGVRLSKRNDRYSNWTRPDKLLVALGAKAATKEAIQQKQETKQRRRPQANTDLEDDKPSFSLEAAYKSPKSSFRALTEIGNRLKSINPEIKISYMDSKEISNLAKLTGHDYSNKRAFVLKGEITINTDRASVSDVIHEYAHLFLHGLKYENPALYQAVISVTNNHSLYANIAADYPHLDSEDLNEEVFVTVLGEYLNNQLRPIDKQNMDDNSDTILNFAAYAKNNLNQAFNKNGDTLYDIDPKKIMQMSFEDVINLVGDQLMNNKITDVNRGYNLTSSDALEPILQELLKKGLLTNEC